MSKTVRPNEQGKRAAKRAVLKAPGQLEFEDVALDTETLAGDMIYAETVCSAVSIGTETAAFLGLPPLRPNVTYPRLVGYCNVARVVKVGAKIKSTIKEGDRILTNQSHQSAFICPASEVLAVVPDTVSSDVASLTYLAQLGLAALQRADCRKGESVGILGLGVIGLSTVGVAVALGATVVAIGNDERRMHKAKEMGSSEVFYSGVPELLQRVEVATSGHGIDVLVTTANSWEAWRQALEVVRPNGRIAVLGFPGRGEGTPSFNPLEPQWFYSKQLTILAAGTVPDRSGVSLQANMRLVVDWIQQGLLPLERLITHRHAWHELELVYRQAAAKDRSLIGTVLDWNT